MRLSLKNRPYVKHLHMHRFYFLYILMDSVEIISIIHKHISYISPSQRNCDQDLMTYDSHCVYPDIDL